MKQGLLGRRWIFWPAVAVAAALVLASGANLYVDRAMGDAVRRGLDCANPGKVRLDSASVTLWGGSIELCGLTLGNPPGYSSRTMLSLDRATLKVRPGTLLSKRIEVEHMALERPAIRVEVGAGRSNVHVFLANAQANWAAGATMPFNKDARLLVDRLTIRGGRMIVATPDGNTRSIPLQGIELTNLHGRDDRGIDNTELLASVVCELTRQGAIEGQIDIYALIPRDVMRTSKAMWMTSAAVLSADPVLIGKSWWNMVDGMSSPRS
jgi:hypothetical protein